MIPQDILKYIVTRFLTVEEIINTGIDICNIKLENRVGIREYIHYYATETVISFEDHILHVIYNIPLPHKASYTLNINGYEFIIKVQWKEVECSVKVTCRKID